MAWNQNLRTLVRILLAGIFLSVNMVVPSDVSAQPDEPAEKPERYWTTRWSFDDVDVGQLADRLGAIGIETGVDLEGTVSVRFNVGIPWTSLGDGAAYRFDGTLTSPRLLVDGVAVKDLSTSINYRDGVASLEKLKATVLDRRTGSANPIGSPEANAGELVATASVELVPQGDVSADVRIDQLSLDSLSDLVRKFLPDQSGFIPTAGQVSTEFEVQVPLSSISDLATYQLTGRASGRGVVLADLPPSDLDVGRVQISDQVLSMTEVSLTANAEEQPSRSIRLFGDASIPLNGVGELQLNLSGDDIPTGTVAALLIEPSSEVSIIEGKVDFILTGRGQFNEQIQDSRWTLEGMIASPQLMVAGVDLGTLEHQVRFTESELRLTPKRNPQDLPDRFEIERFESTYQISEQAMTLSNLDALIFGGRVSGSATVPLESAGTVKADLTVEELRPTIRIGTFADRQVDVTATLSGELDWSVPIDKAAEPLAHRGTANLQVAAIQLGDVNVGQLNADLDAGQSEWSLTADGTLLDGKVRVETIAAMEAGDLWSDAISRMRDTKATFDGIDLEPLLSWFLGQRSDLTGKLSGTIGVRSFASDLVGSDDPNVNAPASHVWELPAIEVDLSLVQLRYRSRLLSRSMNLESRVDNGIVEIESLMGDYATGTARAAGRVHLIDRQQQFHPRVDLRASISRVAIDRGLWFLSDLAESYQGRASGSVTVAGYGESIRVRGSVDGRDLIFYGLGLGDAHSGIQMNANLSRRSWSVLFPTIRSGVGGGQVDGELALSSTRRGGAGVDLESRWRTRRVDFFRLSTQLGKATTFAQGEITGDLVIGGKSIRTIDDLAGRFRFRLEETRGAAVPGLIGISRLLGPVSLTNQTFHEGEANGIIGRGAVVMDEFWMASQDVLIRADGKVFLRSGRMDMEALIATGNYQDVAAEFAELAAQYALRALLPASAILDVSELLCDRTLVVSILGTTANPIVRLLPVETFREEAARFLLREGQRVILAGVSTGTVGGVLGDQ
ncbi:AsmA-like C-terminal region-containing protein [Neorhodopirellula pilleata]|nr:AsmA-like C-terminal region-containing protein [Neorhodopirellula pilleata]